MRWSVPRDRRTRGARAAREHGAASLPATCGRAHKRACAICGNNAMKQRSRAKHKGRRDGGSFFALPHGVMDASSFRMLSGSAAKLLLDLCRQFRGANNGDLSAAWNIMRLRGWRSRDTLARALRELLEAGLIERTRQGGLHRCSLFALTWLAIDGCDGKLDVPATRTPSGLWREPKAHPEKQNASTESVSIWPGIRVNRAEAA